MMEETIDENRLEERRVPPSLRGSVPRKPERQVRGKKDAVDSATDWRIGQQELAKINKAAPLTKATLGIFGRAGGMFKRADDGFLRVAPEFLTLVYMWPSEASESGIHFCFFVSEKVEPQVTVCAVDPHGREKQGRLASFMRVTQISPLELKELKAAIEMFEKEFNISSHRYKYTRWAIRSQKKKGGPHSLHWHMKVFVETEALCELLPAMRSMKGILSTEALKDFPYLQRSFDVLGKYRAWEDVYEQLLLDAQEYEKNSASFDYKEPPQHAPLAPSRTRPPGKWPNSALNKT